MVLGILRCGGAWLCPEAGLVLLELAPANIVSMKCSECVNALDKFLLRSLSPGIVGNTTLLKKGAGQVAWRGGALPSSSSRLTCALHLGALANLVTFARSSRLETNFS